MINLEYTYSFLSKQFYSEQPVHIYPNAKLIILNNSLINELDLNFCNKSQEQILNFFLGYSSKRPISQAYAGHQFGHFTILGDGRAILIGEYIKPNGDIVDFHLKGAGLTKFSRGGDGKATLASMLREYIISEAMYNLGIPTSRIIAVISTGESIQRNGLKQGAIALRVASSHIRVGTFQYAAMLGSNYSEELLEYTIKKYNIKSSYNKALSLIDYVIEKQTNLIIEWERVGFIHGVMNTDNMTISGETIDYGPCAFMDIYDPNTVFSSIDYNRRYSFANQKKIALWNITRLIESLLKLISKNESTAIGLAKNKLLKFSETYKIKWKKMFFSKIGVSSYQEDSVKIILDLLKTMFEYKLDYTNIFYNLTYKNIDVLECNHLGAWLNNYIFKKDINNLNNKKINPVIIPRNHHVEKAISYAENNNFKYFNNLVEVLKSPYIFSNLNTKYMLEPLEEEKIRFTYCGT